jgi:hypothetical protein
MIEKISALRLKKRFFRRGWTGAKPFSFGIRVPHPRRVFIFCG